MKFFLLLLVAVLGAVTIHIVADSDPGDSLTKDQLASFGGQLGIIEGKTCQIAGVTCSSSNVSDCEALGQGVQCITRCTETTEQQRKCKTATGQCNSGTIPHDCGAAWKGICDDEGDCVGATQTQDNCLDFFHLCSV